MGTIKTTFKAIHQGGTVCDYCRYLKDAGFGEEDRLEIYRDRDTPDLIIHDILRMAELTVREEPRLSYQKHKVMSEKDKARLRSRMPVEATRSAQGEV